MSNVKSERDLEAMRPACVVAAKVLDDVTSWIQPGIAAWWPDTLLDAFFEHPRNPLAG